MLNSLAVAQRKTDAAQRKTDEQLRKTDAQLQAFIRAARSGNGHTKRKIDIQ